MSEHAGCPIVLCLFGNVYLRCVQEETLIVFSVVKVSFMTYVEIDIAIKDIEVCKPP